MPYYTQPAMLIVVFAIAPLFPSGAGADAATLYAAVVPESHERSTDVGNVPGQRYLAQRTAADTPPVRRDAHRGDAPPPETPPADVTFRVRVEDLKVPFAITPERREWLEALADFYSDDPADETFAALEKWLVRFRRELKPTAEGIILLEFAYEALSHPVLREPTAAQWEKHLEKLQRWRTLHPESDSADAALGHAYFTRGMYARGSGLASTVTAQGWKQLAEDIPRARESLERAASRLKDDPQIYAKLIAVATIEGASRDETEGYLNRAKEIAPAYFPPYQEMLTYLLPRWHGEPGDSERFATESAEQLGGDQGLELLGRLVFRMCHFERDAAELFPLDQVWKAARLMHELYPASPRHLQFAAKAACMAGEREAARELFAQIEAEPDLPIWSRAKVFEAYRRWSQPDWPTGQERRLLWHSRNGFANGLACSPDGKLIVTAGWAGSRAIKFWDFASGELLATLPSGTVAIIGVAFSPDGKRLALGTFQGPVILIDPQTLESLATLMGHRASASGLAFSPDSRLLASAATDDTIRLWDVAGENEKFTLQDPAVTDPWRLHFSPDGKHLVAYGQTLRAWNTATGQPADLPQYLHHLAGFRPDGTAVAIARDCRYVQEFDLRTGERRSLFQLPPGRNVAYLSPDGRTLAVFNQQSAAGADPASSFRLHLWDIATARQTATCEGHSSDINRVIFSPDSRTVITASDDGTVRLWDVPPPAAAPAPTP